MNASESNRTEEPGLRSTIKSDLFRDDFFRSFTRDIKDLKEFYINSEKKKRLVGMNPVKRIFVMTWWILRSMVLKLTPLRRLLLLFGILILLSSGTIAFSNDDANISVNRGIFGGALIIFVLMLELKDKLLAHDELAAGRKIQEALQPEQSPYIEGWTAWLYTRPANEVCGDLVDFININKERMGVIMADVAGKGLNAALLTTKLQATIRALASDYDAQTLIAKVNNTFHRDSLRNIFASLIYVELSPGSGVVKIVNAGHLPPLIIRSGVVNEMDKGATALGLMKDASYLMQTTELHTGDVILAYSDGVTESKNSSGEFYGKDRFFKLMNLVKTLPVREMGESIVKAISGFEGDERSNDDLSLIILKKM